MATLRFHLCDTRVGWIGLVLSEKGLRGATVPRKTREAALEDVMALGATDPAAGGEAAEVARRLEEYGEGSPVRFDDLPLDWDSLSAGRRSLTPFRRAVLEEALRIPLGETRSYGWLAERVGRPRAARAVGRVMATNPFPVVVPCHRVVAADGSLGGYGGGLDAKESLLRLEGARVRSRVTDQRV
ncbi:MAG: methylated-DNA--[protein]-cysteine S-methyltransferase [Chloroflexi bacterium]|nr:methylated-DNA--[protein]-cysteine S-methyltransferase [Chloroflexota bacterium]